MNTFALKSLFQALALALGIALSACSTIRTRTMAGGPVEMNEAEFAAHVEHVFRYHNRVLNDLIEHAGETPDGTIEAAEGRMAQACDPLNEVVSASADRRRPSFATMLKLADSVPACEQATHDVESLLPKDYFQSPDLHEHSLLHQGTGRRSGGQ